MSANKEVQSNMSLGEIFAKCGINLELAWHHEIKINMITDDSRNVSKGALFIAIKGLKHDGSDFIDQALTNGASAVLYDADANCKLTKSNRLIPVSDLKQKVSSLASAYYQDPSASMEIIGVTGTNGKTTCCYLLAQALKNSAFLGTVGIGVPPALQPNDLTTPDAITLQKTLADFLQKGLTSVCMEVSSHALSQYRTDAIDFNIIGFTNLTHDHLDYHGDIESYQNAKKRLFVAAENKIFIINIDDPFGKKLQKTTLGQRQITYGISNGDITASNIKHGINGLSFVCHIYGKEIKISSKMIGEFNVYNILFVVSVLYHRCFKLSEISEIIKNLDPPPGRMQLLPRQKNAPQTVIDFAHTPDALYKSLKIIRPLCRGKLVVIFGCGGNRDIEKRNIMGSVANELADEIILTNDNPRDENPNEIINSIKLGITTTPVKSIENREEAIKTALKSNTKEDWVLIAGKGHEATQIINDQIIVFNDFECAKKILDSL